MTAPKPAGGVTGWIDGRIEVATTTAVTILRDDLIAAVKEAIHEEIAAIPGQLETVIDTAIPAKFAPAVNGELNAVLPDLLSGNLEKIVPDLIQTNLGPFASVLNSLQGLLGSLPHIPGFGTEKP